MDGGLSVPEDGDVLRWEVNHCDESCRPDEYPVLPVQRAGKVLWADKLVGIFPILPFCLKIQSIKP